MIKKKFAVLALLFILVLTACSTTSEVLSVVPEGPTEDELVEKREEMVLLLNSEEAQAKLDGIALVKELGLENDPEVCEQLIGFLDDFQDDGEVTTFILSSFNGVPEDEDGKCEMALMDQFAYAGEQGFEKLEFDIYQVILEKDFDENLDLYKAYLNRTLEESDVEALNQFMVLSGKFASKSQLLEMIEPFKESSYFFFNDVTEETALYLCVQYLNKAASQIMLPEIEDLDHELFLIDLYVNKASEIVSDKNISVRQNDINNLEALLTADILTDTDYINSTNGRCKTISIIEEILNIYDFGPSQSVCNSSLAYLDSLEGNEVTQVDYRSNGRYLIDTIQHAFDLVGYCETQERSDAYLNFLIKSSESGSAQINKMLVGELVSLDRKDAAPVISEGIKTWLNFGWSFSEYEMLVHQLTDLDARLGIEMASYILTHHEVEYAELSLEQYETTPQNLLYAYDEVIDFVIELIQEKEISPDQQLVDVLVEDSKTSDVATFKVMKVLGAFNFNVDIVKPFYLDQLNSDQLMLRFIAARMLTSNFNVGLQPFVTYFDDRQLEIVAGAYSVAEEYGDEDLIIDAMMAYGDNDMASFFLNNHGRTLHNASKAWGEEHGYNVDTWIYQGMGID
jgi:hypothetical protein